MTLFQCNTICNNFRNGNFVFIHGDTNLSQLVRIINYFSSKDWASFCYDNEQVNPQVALNTFNEILNDRASKPGKDFFTDKKEIIWELGDYKIIYQNDDLYYQYKNTRLKYKLYYTQNFQPFFSPIIEFHINF